MPYKHIKVVKKISKRDLVPYVHISNETGACFKKQLRHWFLATLLCDVRILTGASTSPYRSLPVSQQKLELYITD
jgi:hypothetical protein